MVVLLYIINSGFIYFFYYIVIIPLNHLQMTKIQIVSDTHLEFRGDDFKKLIKPSAPILFLLGDVSACGSPEPWETYKKFIEYLATRFQYIFHVPGNHEYYTLNKNITLEDTIPGIDNKIRKFAKTIPNLFFLNNNTVRLKIGKKDYVFIGTCGWTGVEPKHRKHVQSLMNDYSSIYMPNEKTESNKLNCPSVRKYNINDMSKLHAKAVRYVAGVLKKVKPHETAILLTHHKCVRDEPLTNLLSQAYETDLAGIIIKKPLKFYAFGHTHVKYDKIVNGVRCFSNPKGYPSQQTHFDPSCVVTV